MEDKRPELQFGKTIKRFTRDRKVNGPSCTDSFDDRITCSYLYRIRQD